MQLPLNFHKTFVPERRLIAALLDYTVKGKSGTYAEIAAETGIPMGTSSGKVPAILYYGKGMGLIELESGKGRSTNKPVLTAFGSVVYEEDRLLGKAITQWLAHLHLCLPATGAVAWYKVFAEGRATLGNSFSSQQLEDYLISLFGVGRNRTGPLIRTYLDDAALARASVLRQDKGVIRREKAPLLEDFSLGYAAFFLSVLQNSFADQYQITLTDLNEKVGCFDTCLWGDNEIAQALALIERTGFISIDRQMQPWIMERRADASQVWAEIYSDIA